MQGTFNFLKNDFQEHKIKLVKEFNYRGQISIDKNRIQRVIQNIYSNAKDVMPEGGMFKVETNCLDGNIEIKLSDTGPGIPKEIEKTIFDSFVTSGKQHGTGLGLAIVKKAIEAHNGQISIKSDTRSNKAE